jgi:hypothetical protein
MKKKPIRYIIDPPEIQARVKAKVYARADRQTDKWESCTQPEIEFIGNVRPVWNKATNRFVFRDLTLSDWKRFPLMSSVISSALLLYRTLCLFGAPVKVEHANYKCIWWVCLRHIETGEYLVLGEWKGAAGTWTEYHSAKELPKAFRQDILLLLNELCAPDCPHPYDGLVAGSVA